MLQQTRVAAVLGYYARCLEEVPDVAALAALPEERLMKLWQGLGYYNRARNLQAAARQIMETHGGEFPREYDSVRALKGVGDYTAGAICSIAFGQPVPAVDGNVDLTSFLLFSIGGTLILILMAMVFRDLHLIFKNSENASPFQPDNIRMMKEIGIFAIAVPVIGFIMSVIIRLVTGVESAEISLDLGGILLGIIVLSLTQFFVHGAALEEDVDGLL